MKTTWELTRFYFLYIVRNKYFFALLLAALVFFIFKFSSFFQPYGITFQPYTHVVLDSLAGNFQLFILLIITFFSGELYWKEREEGIAAIYDALSVSTWSFCIAKQLALLLSIALLVTFVMFTGIAYQLINGIWEINWQLYFIQLWAIDFHYYTLILILSFFVHSLFNQKYLAFAIIIFFIFINHYLCPWLGITHHLLRYAKAPELIYSEINSFGNYLKPIFFFRLYWTFVAALLFLLTYLFWARGNEQTFRIRGIIATQKLKNSIWRPMLMNIIFVLLSGTYIYYNTNILNSFRPNKVRQQEAANYEKLYKKYEAIPQPTITYAQLEVDFHPENQSMLVHGKYQLVNLDSTTIDVIHLMLPTRTVIYHTPLELEERIKLEAIDLSVPYEIQSWDSTHSYYIFQLEKVVQANDSLELDFQLSYVHQGFKNQLNPHLDLLKDGSLFYSMYWPTLGYRSMDELKDNGIRRKMGLLPTSPLPEPRDSCCQFEYIPNVDFIIRTPKNYQAIASGHLKQQQQSDSLIERQYLTKGLPCFLVGQYEVYRSKWQDYSIEIYHHPQHQEHLERMMSIVQATLDYCQENFGAYPFQDLKIVEYPRYANHAFATTALIAYPEMSFIEKPPKTGDFDRISMVLAHEVAHEWWGAELYGGNLKGTTVLSETMAQYIGMMVMKKHFGEASLETFRQREKHRYLVGRSHEEKQENPLLFVEGQNYIHYHKGSAIMYALQAYIGEENLNRGLRNYYQSIIKQRGTTGNSLDWYDAIKAQIPDSLHYFLEDQLLNITFHELSIEQATWQNDDELLIDLEAKKTQVQEHGKEQEINMQDWVEIACYSLGNELLYLEKHKLQSGKNQLSIRLDRLPHKVVLDPRELLVEKNVGDNVFVIK